MLCLLAGVSVMAKSQIVTVKDQQSGEPLVLATLYSDEPRAQATTNSQGQADISAFERAENIELRMLGYVTLHLSYQQLADSTFEVAMTPSAINLDQVVVSATKWRQVSSDVPTKIISISPDQVAFQNPQTAADLLGISGKVFIQKSQQGGGSPMIRGLATNRLLYAVDGVRMNTAIFRGGNIQNVISLDPLAIEHSEVLFGPGSVIYGSDAIGGVMSFQTLKPTFSLTDQVDVSGKAFLRHATANKELTGHFDINLGWKKWAFVSSFSHNDYDDLKMGSNGPDDYLKPYRVIRENGQDVVLDNEDPRIQDPSGYSQMNLMQKVRFRPNQHWDFEYAFHFSETSDYGRYDRHLRTRNGGPRYGEWSYGPQKWLMNQLSVNHTANAGLFDEMTLRLAQQQFEESRRSRNLNSNDREVRIEEVDAYSVNLDLVKRLNSRHSLFYGLEWVTNAVNSIGRDENIETGVSVPGPARYPNADWYSMAAYITGQHRMSDQLTLQTGLRYNQYKLDATFDTSFYPFPFTEANLNDGGLTGSLGVVFRPSSSLVLSSNFSTGFRSPNVDDVGKVFDSEPGAVVVPNPDLEAEYAYNFDLGLAKVFSETLKVDFTAYYTSLQNALVRRDFTLNGMDEIVYDGELSRVQAIQNAAVAEIYGLQFGLELKLPEGFSFSTDYNLQHGEEELDDGSKSPSRHAAPSFGISRLNYTGSKIDLQLYATYQSEVSFDDLPVSEQGKTEIYAADKNGDPYAPAWYTLNFKSEYHLTNELAITGGVENITDQRYRPYSSGISGAGRSYILAVRFSF